MRKQLGNALVVYHFSGMRNSAYALRGVREHGSDFTIPLERCSDVPHSFDGGTELGILGGVDFSCFGGL